MGEGEGVGACDSAGPPPAPSSPPTASAFLHQESLPRLYHAGVIDHLICGASARITAAALLSPMDTVKTRLQFQGSNYGVVRYNGVGDAFAKIYKNEGIRGFYKGLPPRLLYMTPAAAISFAVYEQIRAIMVSEEQSVVNPLIPLAAGGLARVLGTGARTPFDIVRQRLQLQGNFAQKKYTGTFDAFKKVARHDGLRGLFAGYWITLLRDAPFAGLYFTSYELLKAAQNGKLWDIIRVRRGELARDEVERKEYRSLGPTNHLFAGAVSGCVAASMTIPFDVVKTRLQTMTTLPVEARPPIDGVMSCFRYIYRTEGWRGLVAGLGPRLTIIAPAAAITFACYEAYKGWMKQFREWRKANKQTSGNV